MCFAKRRKKKKENYENPKLNERQKGYPKGKTANEINSLIEMSSCPLGAG